MPGIIHLYICDNKVYKIPSPRDGIYKAVMDLANKDVLYTYLIYTTENRKPDILTDVFFDNYSIDNNGQYISTQDETDRKTFNFIHFGFTNAKSLSEREEPWVIPQAPVIPSQREKTIIIDYLINNYPSLANNALWVIENHITTITQRHKKTIEMIREARKLKIQNNNR